MRKNPLKQLTDEELKDYEFCLSQNFCKVTVGNKVTEDYSRWLPTYNNLILYVVLYTNLMILVVVKHLGRQQNIVKQLLIKNEKK